MIDFIKENVDKYTRKELAEKLGITVSKLYKLLEECGIKKNEKLSKNAKNKRWTEKEIKSLEKYRNENKTVKEIAELLNRSKSAIAWKCIGNRVTKEWTREEEEMLVKIYRKYNTEQLIKIFPTHTFNAIKNRARRLNLKRENIKNKKWENEEVKLIEKLFYKGYDDKKISKQLNRTECAIKKYTKRLRGRNLFWTKEDIKILKENYKLPNREIKEKLLPYRSLISIERKVRCLGLKKPKSYIWTNKEIELLKKEYPLKTINELILIFTDKTKQRIRDKAKSLKLRKRKDIYLKCFNYNVVKLPKERDKWRTAILKRDKYCCKKCGFKDKTSKLLNAHHIIPVRINKDKKLDINNGICLCVECHIKIYNKEENYIKYFQSILGDKNDFFKRG